MEHRRHYTLAQANAMRPWVAERVVRLRAARDRLRRGDSAQFAAEASLSGGGWPGRAYATAATTVTLTLEELDRLDVVVRDADRGVVDFPALRGGEEVYLCWLVGEPAVTHWHALEAGFGGRRRV
ncbi:MAG: hypothetical protein AVDCRST_MAG65-1904 [uncultured Solirubrobacteraceae bacterium]|uniref:DUF2203 domain-containing protein n=1 Tax=uncultured Solirubrobacteraceae bacterium TaxID=1162706 RepID=A0A6J4S3H5_9ACTN|nr:MAG: hypothetical protein AVDCRST_MAG65-1904 [uncultured Solirubrobacteraceae bacterium]